MRALSTQGRRIVRHSLPVSCAEGIDGLLVAGKAISTDRASYKRFLQETMVTGQAAGVAAAVCARKSITPRQLEQDVSELQDILLKQGVILLGPIEKHRIQ